jgi:hypothetical protein
MYAKSTKGKKTKGLMLGSVLLVLAGMLILAHSTWPSLQNTVFATARPLKDWVKQQLTLVPAEQAKLQDRHAQVAYKFIILSDTHQDVAYFPKIVDEIAKRQDSAFVAHLGDLTDAGEQDKLIEAKQVLDRIPEKVYVLPGDHDLNWIPRHDLTNFKAVFGEKKTYYSFNKGQEHYIFIDNSDLNTGIDEEQWQWLEADLRRYKRQHIYALMSTPLSNPYLSFKKMGSQNDLVAQQAVRLEKLLGQYDTKAMFAGDTHTFAQYDDALTHIPTITVGSAGSTKNPLPLYVLVEIFNNGGYNVTSVPYSSSIPVQGTD